MFVWLATAPRSDRRRLASALNPGQAQRPMAHTGRSNGPRVQETPRRKKQLFSSPFINNKLPQSDKWKRSFQGVSASVFLAAFICRRYLPSSATYRFSGRWRQDPTRRSNQQAFRAAYYTSITPLLACPRKGAAKPERLFLPKSFESAEMFLMSF